MNCSGRIFPKADYQKSVCGKIFSSRKNPKGRTEMPKGPSKPGTIHLAMIEALKAHPDGLSEVGLRRAMNVPTDEQAQFGRRRRDLKRWFLIEKRGSGINTVYVYKGVREKPLFDADIDSKTRAEILHEAHGRCGMCGRTIENHGITLAVDHKIPRDWGGSGEKENLWAICEECNGGKKAHFASQNQDLMKKVMGFSSVHVRIGELLKANFRQPVSSRLISFVADRDDWKKRTRELRYLGWEISVSRKTMDGKSIAFYTLLTYSEWPENPTKWIQEYERTRAERNRRADEHDHDGDE